jgi:hypothetical protein
MGRNVQLQWKQHIKNFTEDIMWEVNGRKFIAGKTDKFIEYRTRNHLYTSIYM